MKNINGTNYISVKEYAELKNLTAGRIYQLKNELPFEKFEDLGIELINFDLLQLSEKESSLAHTKFQTTHALHTYDYKQLGLFVAEMLKTSNEARANSEILLREKDVLMEEKTILLGELTETNKELMYNLSQAKEENQGLTSDLENKTETLEKQVQLLEVQKKDFEVLNTEKENGIKEIEELKLAQQKQQADYELKIIENQGLQNELISHKGQVVALTKDVEKSNLVLESLKNDNQGLITQKEELSKELTASKSQHQKAVFDYELKIVENQGIINENNIYKSQIEALSKNIQSEKGFNTRLDKLEEIILATTAPSTPKTDTIKPKTAKIQK